MRDLSFMSSDYGTLDVYRMLHDAHPGSVPTHVITLLGAKQYFCGSLRVAGVIIQELGQGQMVSNPNHIPYGAFPLKTFSDKEIAQCTLLPFHPMSYRNEPGLLETILQSGDEALFQMHDYPLKEGWAVYWDWSSTFPEQEFLFFP